MFKVFITRFKTRRLSDGDANCCTAHAWWYGLASLHQ